MNWKNLDKKRKKIIILAIVLVCSLSAIFYYGSVKGSITQNQNTASSENSEENLSVYDLSPIDKEGSKRVKQEEAINENETWTICYYMVGSDLEDQAENDLSDLTRLLTQDTASQNKEAEETKKSNYLSEYAQQLQSKGLDFPEYLYEPVQPTASSEDSSEDVILAEGEGAASSDISEICKGVKSDKINVVIQTGGATRWSNSLINPNKTQRFTVKDGHLEELENMPLKDSCSSDTLADFLTYCDQNYPADHRMLVLWDHGGGANGYGKDSIYNSSLSLNEIQSALEKVCESNPDNPHYDLIGYDACLMASTENAHMLYGYGKYLVGGEETEPGGGWSHDVYLKAMSKDPTMSAASIGKTIVDSFEDFYMEKNCEMGNIPFYSITTSFSLIDLNAAEQTYQAYCELNEKLLEDSVADNHVLTKIASAAQNSTRYSGEAYEIYNLIDLGNYMEALSTSYSSECEKVLQNLKQAVAYHRSNGYLSDSMGINIYMPVSINNTNGLDFFLSYLKEISEDSATQALYYYKVSGCLNDEYQAYADQQGYGQAKTIETSALKKLSDNEITLKKNGFQISLNDEQKNNYQNAAIEVAAYDEEKNQLIAYGKTNEVIEKDGVIKSDFDGKWICLDGQALYTEVVSESDQSIAYRSPVKINKEDYYLLFSYDKEKKTVSLTGASMYNADAEADASQAHVIGKTTISLEEGDVIRPVYKVYNLKTNKEKIKKSKEKITFTSSTKLTMDSLPDGNYLNAFVLTDIRGDEYYSGVVEQTLKKSTIASQKINKDFVGSTY